ncbi:fimbrial protein [Pseudomonas chlororaphis]|uniref:fimbrial protein n=1 Tax=Pseudomonas chlororaphis TaxID=587753 RepID=UPI0039E226FD
MSDFRLSVWALLSMFLFELSAYSMAHAAGGANTVVILPGGRLTLSGAVMSGGCLISVSNSDKLVFMGEVRSNQFMGVGSDTQAVPFSIQLEECSSNVIESVAFGFTGAVNQQDLQVLATTPGPSAAKGIGLALFSADNQLLPINAEPTSFTPLNNGVNTLRFLAKYRLTQQHLIPGVANAWADFTLTYQ